jgi:hypothetical protein
MKQIHLISDTIRFKAIERGEPAILLFPDTGVEIYQQRILFRIEFFDDSGSCVSSRQKTFSRAEEPGLPMNKFLMI